MLGLINKKKVIRTAVEIIAEYNASKVDYAKDRYATQCYKDGHDNALRGLVGRLKLIDPDTFSKMILEEERKCGMNI